MTDSDPATLYATVVDGLQALGIGFIDMVEGETTSGEVPPPPFDFAALRARFKGVYLANNQYTFESANAAIHSGHADLVSFGRPFIANPDLVERFRRGAPLNDLGKDAYFGEGSVGYTDYPTLDAMLTG
jgi:N-ethylmaleimide reductase